MSDYFTEVFSWGGDHSGQLGLGTNPLGKTYPVPRYCTYNIAIRQISCGDDHSAFITSKHEQ
jgi:X-linked retinitis pigmentosa GTPase regulator